MFRWDAIADTEVRRRCHTVGVANFHRALPILAAGEFPVVVDHVFERPEWHEACRAALAGKTQLWVGVKCPMEILRAREAARKDRRIGLAEYQFGRVHDNQSYDLEVDTSVLSSEACADQILSRLGLIPSP
jgi:chloramphenicol 3-O phosphotransferase